MTKPPLLLLSHRIPYPPDKGDKIRSFHLLRHLAKHYRVFLGSFVDDPHDWKYVAPLQSLCEDVRIEKLDKTRSCLRGLPRVALGEALTYACYASRPLKRWVREQIERHDIGRVVVYSSAMAQFVPARRAALRTVIDFVDVDSDKWRQYAERKPWPLSLAYRMEAKRLLSRDRDVAANFDYSFFVSEPEAALFKTLAPESAPKVGFYNNGVDGDYFSPAHELTNPYPEGEVPIVFTGAMDYWPNVDAVEWFAGRIFPTIRKELPGASFYIVGANPGEGVRALARQPGIVVTGRVEDVRPYLKFAAVSVAPLRVARGVQNKVLEAMAMARPVVVTPQGLEGIAAREGEEVLCAPDEQAFIVRLREVLAEGGAQLGEAARKRVLNDFGWEGNLARITRVLEESPA